MSATELLWCVLLVEGVVFAACLISIFGHGAWTMYFERWAAPRMERGRGVLAGVAVRPQVDSANLARLRELPRRLQVRLFTELVPSVAGSQRRQLTSLAGEIGLTAAAERLCGDSRWWRRLRGVRLLTALGGGEKAVTPLFRDRHPAVRAEAVEWAADHPSDEVIARLVPLLADPKSVGSWVLRDTLLRIGHPALPRLAEYLETHSGREAEAALDVAAGLPDPRLAAAAERLCRDPLPAVRARAASLAGAIGGDELVAVLGEMLGDADPFVRAAAAAALGRLGHWPAASSIARLLRDPAWVCRSQAALALRRLGSPGHLLLRRALDDADRFAADIARQVLDMPETTAEHDQWR
ncbi:MAG TPA: HEAT repeat domain-containing protein [Longimicrobium sp.]|nr:HEAT repeat domain-containing protein [Longimicrobium sp.]